MTEEEKEREDAIHEAHKALDLLTAYNVCVHGMCWVSFDQTIHAVDLEDCIRKLDNIALEYDDNPLDDAYADITWFDEEGNEARYEDDVELDTRVTAWDARQFVEKLAQSPQDMTLEEIFAEARRLCDKRRRAVLASSVVPGTTQATEPTRS